ncbi:uncharacterized protein LOC121381302 [Gigantopelta aegis]|uniref:uncharacterized protein LOC121381302 n=1 Tax=Gigantopelta aegis TaxID=1735272 RepID=UPI001B888E07|nr:uncharacterized protein LOC121381302 [Gigantopelta aegis]
MLMLKYFSFLFFIFGVTEALRECTDKYGHDCDCCDGKCCVIWTLYDTLIFVGVVVFIIACCVACCGWHFYHRDTTTTRLSSAVNITRFVLPGEATPGLVNPSPYSLPVQQTTNNAQIPMDAVYSYDQ